MPYKGGKVASASGGVVQSADDTYSYWGQANRCNGPGNPVPLPDLDKGDGTKIELLTAQRCAPRGDTVFLRVVGGGHQLPSRPAVPRGSVDRGTGAANHDIDTAEEIWSFAAGKRR
jgi:poly(3-hydroxybutyrate) depolymerase